MVSVRAVCSAQACLLFMLTVFCVRCMNQVVVVTGTVYIFAGALFYTDDLTILAPSADGLIKMLGVCEEFACSRHVLFNPAKTVNFNPANTVNFSCSASFIFCGQHLTMLDSVVQPVNELI